MDGSIRDTFSGGGANPGDDLLIGHGFIAIVPTTRAINPITKTNWEHVGVKPDLAVSAKSAMKVACATILNRLKTKSSNPDEKVEMKDILARVQSGALQLPADYPRH